MTLTTIEDFMKPPTSQISLPVIIGAAIGGVLSVAILVTILVIILM